MSFSVLGEIKTYSGEIVMSVAALFEQNCGD